MTQSTYPHWGDRVAQISAETGELVLGVDPVPERIPRVFRPTTSDAEWLDDYIETLLSAAKGLVGVVKYQSAYFEALGSPGICALSRCIRRARALNFAVILDAKRGDIGATGAAYALAYLTPAAHGGSDLEVDCMTVNPFLGPDSLEPFIECARRYGKGVFVQVKNSNPGSGWLQDRLVGSQRVSDLVGRLVADWSAQTLGVSGLSSVGAVVGVTYPEDGARLRTVMPDSIFLAPGYGAQGGRSEDVAVMRRATGDGVLVPVSRSVCDVADLGIAQSEYHDVVAERLMRIGELVAGPARI